MGARQKLNSISLTIAIGLSMLAGLLTQSAIVFGIALAVLITANINSGSIRPDKHRRR